MEFALISQQGNANRRTRILSAVIVMFLVLGAGWFAYWFVALRHHESTDDAYVAGNLVQITPQVSGSVSVILVDNTQGVTAGQVLVRLDPADAEIALAKARTNLADAVRKTYSLMASAERLRNLVEQRKRELIRADGDLERRSHTRTARAVSEEELSHAYDAVAVIGAALRVAEEDLRATNVLLQDTPVALQPAVQLAAQQLREAWLARQRCDIKSPVDGYVARRAVQVGTRLSPGVPLMAVVPLREVWVDANFKEVQIERMRIGQPVHVEADAYGSKVVYTGKVVGLAAGTGSVFSLLPPENATGNWIKVVQRVPVKVVLDDKQLVGDFPLRVGLSCGVQVDVSDTTGKTLLTEVPVAPAYSTTVLEYDTTPVEREIAGILLENSPQSKNVEPVSGGHRGAFSAQHSTSANHGAVPAEGSGASSSAR